MSYEMQKKNGVEERVFSVTMTEEELRLFSEFLEQREYAGPVKMQNKALKKQYLMKKHNIRDWDYMMTSRALAAIPLEPARGPHFDKILPKKYVKRNGEYVHDKNGKLIPRNNYQPRVKRSLAQAEQEAGLHTARQQERSLPEVDRYHYGQRDGNRKSLNTRITSGEKTKTRVSKPEVYKGEKHIATRSIPQSIKDYFTVNREGTTAMNDPYLMGIRHGKNIKTKGLE